MPPQPKVVLTSPRSEMARIIEENLEIDPVAAGNQRVVINTALLRPNTLLHDGHAWKRLPPDRILSETRSAIRRARRADFLVHASWHLAGAYESGLDVPDTLVPYIEAALSAERLVLESRVPACVVRLAYLYGPETRDLAAYRRAFRLSRPYWAGPAEVRQRFIHSHDAARALLLAARQQQADKVLTAHDNQPVSFSAFMDHFAHLVGNPLPLHLPVQLRQFTYWLIAAEHMEMVQLPTAQIPPGRRPRGFHPVYISYRSGLRDVVDALNRS